MSRRRPLGRHSRIPHPSPEHRRPVVIVVAVAVAAIVGVATLLGLTVRPTADAGRTPGADPASETTWSSGSVAASRTPRLEGPAESRPATDAAASRRPDTPRASRTTAGAGDTRTPEPSATHSGGGGDRTRLKKPTAHTSTQVRMTRPPSATTSSPDPSETTSSAGATPSSPSPTSSRCSSPHPSSLWWRLTCPPHSLLP